MTIWTCGNSPRSGSRNACKRNKNVNGASRLTNFWNFFGAIQMISRRNWWPWSKAGYITMTRRQSNNQWSRGIAAQPAPKNYECKNPLEKFSPRFFGDQDGILLIDYLPKGQTINMEYCSSLLVQLKDILKEKRHGKVTKGVLFLHDNAPAHRALATQKKLAYLGWLPLSWPPTLFSGSGPVGLPPVPWTENTIERSPFFVWHRGHRCHGDLVGQTTFRIFFEWLAKVTATG